MPGLLDYVEQSYPGLLGKLGQTWPAQAGKAAIRGLLAPGNAWQSTPDNPVTTDQMIGPAADLAGLVTLGAGAIPAEANSLRSGLKRLPSSDSLAIPDAPSLDDMARASRIESVPLSQIRGTQPKMNWDKFDKGDYPPPLLKGYEDLPVAVRREDGEYLMFDGHHRSVRAINNGDTSMPMYVINAKDYAPHLAGRKPASDNIDTGELLKRLLE